MHMIIMFTSTDSLFLVGVPKADFFSYITLHFSTFALCTYKTFCFISGCLKTEGMEGLHVSLHSKYGMESWKGIEIKRYGENPNVFVVSVLLCHTILLDLLPK